MAQNEKLERILADVPRDLKRRAAAKAALEGRTLKDVLIKQQNRSEPAFTMASTSGRNRTNPPTGGDRVLE